MMRRSAALLILCVASFVYLVTARSGKTTAGAKPAERSFEFTYSTVVDHIPKGARTVEVWIPYPASDPHQTISDVKVSSPYRTDITRDPQTGNQILHLSLANPKEDSLPIEVTFHVTRDEYVRKDFSRAKPVSPQDPALAAYLRPDRLVPLDERIRSLSAQVTTGANTPLEKARAIYDYVVATMKYDKSGSGWGNGDINWACDAKRGNCTDFHALFIGLARAQGIPARFSIGFPLPAERGAGEIPGYHCWAEFYLAGYGWVPIDASEAWKHPERKAYYFGAHDENRVQLSTGRDLALVPRQKGEPLNYFVYPYVEVDGVPYKNVSKTFRYRDDSAARS